MTCGGNVRGSPFQATSGSGGNGGVAAGGAGETIESCTALPVGGETVLSGSGIASDTGRTSVVTIFPSCPRIMRLGGREGAGGIFAAGGSVTFADNVRDVRFFAAGGLDLLKFFF